MRKISSLIICGLILLFINACNRSEAKIASVYQSEREIPVIKNVDVLVIGGTVAAVSAAVSAANDGATVYLIASRPYLGEDLCATLRLEIDENRVLTTDLEKKIFGTEKITTPLKVKAVLNDVLLDAGVDFIFGSYVTDILWNKENPAGVVIANRSGRQAIKAKLIIDATNRANVCRLAGAESQTLDGSELMFERTLVFEEDDEITYKKVEVKIPMENLDFASFAKAEQIARKQTYDTNQVRASESLFYIPPDPIICNKNKDDWEDSCPSIEHFHVNGFQNLFVLSGSAGIPRDVATKLLKPAALTEIGNEIGVRAAKASKLLPEPSDVNIKSWKLIKNKGDIKENLSGLRKFEVNNEKINCHATSVPVLGKYDVVVVGGGTAGAPAAIGAARQGMKVLVLEYQEGLGGVGTVGLIGKIYHGRKVGFAKEVPFPEGNIEPKMEWYRSEIEKAGGEIWLGVLGCGAYVEGNTVKGAVVSSPQGRGVILANTVIDGTGNADVAIAAGAEYMYGRINKGDIALQGTGMSSRPLKGSYVNSDFLLVDESDMIDNWRTLVSVYKVKNTEDNYDAVPLIQTRERRRIVGDHVMTYLDQIAGRTYPDAIVYSGSDYDSHGYPSSPFFALLPHDDVSRKKNHPAPGGTCYTPYRSLTPENLDGILVIGLGISMDRDASAMIRMQLDMANQGYAAGVAAAMASKAGTTVKNINIKDLQKHLVGNGSLPEEVLKMEDSFPLSKEVIEQAVNALGEATNPKTAGNPLAVILTHKEIAIPIIIEKHKTEEGYAKLMYAQVLGMCGKKEGVPTLIKELERNNSWDEKIFQGKMADYAHLPTPVDALILSLGNSGDEAALPIILEKLETLDASVTLSHHRSVALALEKTGSSEAAEPLARLLAKPNMSGYAMKEIEQSFRSVKNNGKDQLERTNALREITLARALYNCGDFNNIGKTILENYKEDMRGLFSRHATTILNN